MAVSRLTEQLDLFQADNVIMLYGQVNDIFITPNLILYEHDGIDKILLYHLRNHGFERILYYATDRGLYVYDENSYQLCFPQRDPVVQATNTETFLSGQNGRPLNNMRLLPRNEKPRQTTEVPVQSVRRDEDGFIPVLTAEVAIADCLKTCFRDRTYKTAIIFSQFDQNSLKPSIEKLVDNLITRWLRNTSQNKCFFIFNAIDLEQLKHTTDNSPSLKNLLANANKEQTLHALVCLQCPMEDEIRSLINRLRLTENRGLDWLQLEKIVRALVSEQKQLKYWFKKLLQLEKYGVSDINKILLPAWHINEAEQSAWERLERLVGLTELKEQIRSQVRYIKNEIANGNRVLPPAHIVLTGNPGTGKTTAARLIGEIFREEGLLRRGHLIEIDRVQLVAGFIGQTALKTDEACRSALGGVLFIDEAYALAKKEQENDFGKEAIDTLIKRMYDWNMQFVVILAGYPKPMKELLKSNPGFPRRIGRTIHIDDYTPEELTRIFCVMAANSKKLISSELLIELNHIFTRMYTRRDDNFSNAGLVENLLREIGEQHLQRCLKHDLNVLQEPMKCDDLPIRLKEGGGGGDPDIALKELNQLIGLKKVKDHISDLVDEFRYNQMMNEIEDNDDAQMTQKINRHMVFLGNPGTGKTTVARLVGKIFKTLKILSDGSVVETSRVDFVAGYSGQTAIQSKKILESALDKILFIDEAYDLKNGPLDSFGQEAINTILKFAEDHRDRIVIILAGYPQSMTNFFNSNPGLESRFPTRLEFEDYNDDELFEILKKAISNNRHTLDTNAEVEAKKAIALLKAKKTSRTMGNARDIENFYKNTVLINHKKRIMHGIKNGLFSIEDPRLLVITNEDFPGTGLKEQDKSKKAFSPDEEKKKAEEKSNYYTHTGSGDIIGRDKIINYNNCNVYEKKGESIPKFIGPINIEAAKNIINRKTLIESLHRQIFDETKEASLVVTGIPGIGKSSLIRKFATTYASSFQHIIWIECNSTIAESLIGNSILLKYLNYCFQESDSVDTRFELILDKLSEFSDGQTCLLVIDNVMEKHLQEMEKITRIDNFKIIFLSRERLGDFNHFEVGAMSPPESHALFERELAENLKDSAFEELADRVGYHPLVLEVIAKKIRTRYFQNIQEVLDTLITQLSAEKVINLQELNTVFTQLTQRDKLAEDETHWMVQLSILPPTIYSFDEITEIFNINSTEQTRTVSNILRQLLVKGFLSGDINNIHCHPIVSEAIRHSIVPNTQNCELLLSSLGQRLFDRLSKTIERTEIVKVSVKYLSILEKIAPYFDDKVLSERMIFRNISLLANAIGAFNRAKEYIEKDFEFVKHLKQENPIAFCETTRLTADTVNLAGEKEKSLEYIKEAIELLKDHKSALLPEGILELLRLYRDSGALHLQLGAPNEAIEDFKKAEFFLDSLEYEDNYEIGLLNLEIANAAIAFSNFKVARELIKKAENSFKDAEIPDDTPLIGSCYLSRALADAGLGDFSDAQFAIDQGIKIFRETLGEEHIFMSRAYLIKSLLGLISISTQIFFGDEMDEDESLLKRKIKQALEDTAKSIKILEKYRSEEHLEFAMLYSNFGMLSKFDNNNDACLEYHDRAIHILRKQNQGGFTQAIICFRIAAIFIEDDFLTPQKLEEYLLLSEENLPDGEAFSLIRGSTNLLLADIYMKTDRSREAIHELLEAHDQFKIQFKEDHPLHVLCMQTISSLHCKLNEFNKALAYQKQATDICEIHMSPTDPELATSFMLLSEIHREKDERLDALKYRVKAENINPSVLSEIENAGDCGKLYLYYDSNTSKWVFMILTNEELNSLLKKNDVSVISDKLKLDSFGSQYKAAEKTNELTKIYGACSVISPSQK